MPLDTRIALTGQPLQLESPAAQYSQLMSVVNAGTQNQLAQMQMSAAQRAMQEEEDVKNYLARSDVDLSTAEGQRGLLRLGKPGQAMLKSLAEQRKEQALANKSSYEFETQKLDRALSEISNFPDAASALASIDTQVSRKIISPEQATQLKAQINAAPDFSTWQRRTVTGMMAAKDRLDILEEQRYLASRTQPAAAPATAPLPQAMATAPINDTRAALMPVPAERSVNAIQLGDGNVVYRVDGKDVPFAVYADAVRSRNQAQGANAAIAATPAPMAPAAAPAPAAPTPPAPAPAQPDMANALALKIQGLQDERNKLVPFLRSSSAKTQYEDLGKQIEKLSEGFSISAGGARYQPGVGMIERAAAAPAPSDITRLITERNAAVARKAPPDEIAALNAAIKKATTPAQGTTVNVNAGPKAEEVEFRKLLVDQYKEVSARADVAARSLPALDINLKTLDKGFDTGFGTETIAAGAKVLAALGVQNAKDFATDAQTFLANANNAVLQKQLEQKGVQTAADADRITSTGAQLGNTKEANKFILSVAKAQLQRDVAQRKFYSDWRNENETFKGAEDAWYAGPGGASLFDSPILKKYAEPVAGQAEARKVGLDKIFKKAP